MNQIFLIPPSEGKNDEDKYSNELLSYSFDKPISIAINASEKDLKSKGHRYNEGIELNRNIQKNPTLETINRYSGVMFNAINYKAMSDEGKEFFETHFLITSGLYGLLKPKDRIVNYKLPIEARGLYDFWGDSLAQVLSNSDAEFIVNLLPISYAKLFGFNEKPKSQKIIRDIILSKNKKIINVEFYDDNNKKISHGVKKIKGEFIKNICEEGDFNYTKYDFVEKNNMIYVTIRNKK